MACSKVISDFEVLSADDTGRRRDRTDAEKVRIVEESFRGHRQGSATARRYGLSRSLLTRWRKEYREGLLDGGAPAFMPLQIGSEPALATSTATERPAVEERVEITLTNGRRLSVSASIKTTALSRLLRVLDRP
jgi:transposase